MFHSLTTQYLRPFHERFKRSDLYPIFIHGMNYFSGNMATKVLGLFSVFCFTRLMSTSEYGLYAVFMSALEIAAILLSMNSYRAVSRYYLEKTNDFPQFLSATLILVLISFSISLFLFLALADFIQPLIEVPKSAFYFLLPCAFFIATFRVYNQYLIVNHKSLESSIIAFSLALCIFLVAIPLVLSIDSEKYLGRIRAYLIVNIFLSVYCWVKLLRLAKFSFRLPHIKYIFFYSIPMIPSALSGIILAQFDRIMINSIIDSSAAGLYSFAYNIGLLPLMFLGPISSAFLPDFYKFLDSKQYSRLNTVIKKCFSFICVGCLATAFFSKELVTLFSQESFHSSWTLVPVIVSSCLIMGLNSFYSRYIGYAKKTMYGSFIVLTTGALNIYLNSIYIPLYGYTAGAYTTLICYCYMFILTFVISKFILRLHVVPLRFVLPAALMALAFIFVFIIYSNVFVIPSILLWTFKFLAPILYAYLFLYRWR